MNLPKPWRVQTDVPAQIDQHAASVLRELQYRSAEREVVYRDGQRWVPRLQKVDMHQTEKQVLPFKRGGMYVVSGGLGGIGVQVARYLLNHYEARLLLLGRTPLAETVASNAERDTAVPLDQKLAALRALESLPGQVLYRAVDVCDRDRLQQTVTEVQTLWGQAPDGVIHLAGTYHERSLLEETRDEVAAILRPKVVGTVNLADLLEGRPDRVFISFSSITGFFGGSAVGAFAAESVSRAFTPPQPKRPPAELLL